MRKLVAILFCLAAFIGLVSGCTQGTAEPVVEQKEAQIDEKRELEALKEQILITCQYDKEVQNDGKQRVIVTAENTTDKTFTGDVHIMFKVGTKIVGRDMMIIENLTPGNTTWCNMYTEVCAEEPVAEIDFSKGYKFEENAPSSNAVIDEAMSAALKEYFDGNFFSTSWYSEIKKCEVFSQDEKYYAEITVGNPSDQQLTTIGKSTVTNFKKVTLEKVVIKNEAGDSLKTFSQR